jgi:hypothetical protein
MDFLDLCEKIFFLIDNTVGTVLPLPADFF